VVTSVPVPAAPSPENRALMDRGDRMLAIGNVIAARSFYERAMDLGIGEAALKLGDTYDAEFLDRHKLRGIKPDSALAEQWYRKAQEMGVPQAKERLNDDHRLADGRRP
jgi:TPR repeat protein